jgi:homoserine kinase
MVNTSVLIRVPATVGNFAGAVNCAALTLDASLNVKVGPRTDGHVGIRYFGENGERVPRDRSNLIVRAMEAALHVKGREFRGADFEVYSSVPVGVGLGSSTAAVLAGLMAADSLFRLGLDEKTLLDVAGIYECRLDNLHAAWAGGFVACSNSQSSPGYTRTPVPDDFVLSVVVPETPLALGTARARPPELSQYLDFQRAALVAEFFGCPNRGLGLDLQAPVSPTCEKSVPGVDEALRLRRPGLLSVFACGSGPAVGILAQEDRAGAVRAVEECFSQRGVLSKRAEFHSSNSGARDWNAVHPEFALTAAKARAAPHASTLD